MNADTFKVIEMVVTAAIGGGAVAFGRFIVNLMKERSSLDIEKKKAALDYTERQQTIDRSNADYIITHFEKTMADKDRDHAADAAQWQKDKDLILRELKRVRDAHQINLATMEGMRMRLADRERQISELRGGVHPLMAAPDRTDSVIITDIEGNIYYINQNVTLLTKWSDLDLMEKNIDVLFPQNTFPRGQSVGNWFNINGERDQIIKARLRQRDGVLIPVELLISLFPVKGKNNQVWITRFQMRQIFLPEEVDLTPDMYVPPNPSESQFAKAIQDEAKEQAVHSPIIPRPAEPGADRRNPRS